MDVDNEGGVGVVNQQTLVPEGTQGAHGSGTSLKAQERKARFAAAVNRVKGEMDVTRLGPEECREGFGQGTSREKPRLELC